MSCDNVQISKLKNDATVITVNVPTAQSVAFGIFIGVGSRWEKPGEAGVSHFIEHMLFKGTETRSASDISREIEGAGGTMNAYTGEDGTCYYVRVPYECIDSAVDVFMDMFLRSSFRKEDVDRERDVILEEMKMYEDQPDALAMTVSQNAMFPGHALGKPIVGNSKSLNAMSAEKMRAFKSRMYVSTRCVFVFAGRIEHGNSCRLIEREPKIFSKRTFRSAVGNFDPSIAPRRLAIVRRRVQQVQAILAFRSIGIHDSRYHHQRVMDMILGGGMSSRLFQTVREKYGLCYSIYTAAQCFDEIGAYSICGGFEPKKTRAALRLIVKELVKLRSRAPSRQELNRTIRFVNGVFRMGLESATAQMSYYGRSFLNYGKCESPDEMVKRIAAVRPSDVRDMAAEIFRNETASLTLVVPEEDNTTDQEWLDALSGL